MAKQREATLKLNVNAKALKDTFRDLAKNIQSLVADTQKWQDAFEDVDKELERGDKALMRTKARAAPEFLRLRVGQQLDQEEASRKLREAEAQERARQYKPQTFAGKLGQQLGFDVSPGNKGTHSLLGGFAKRIGLSDEAAGLAGGIGKAFAPIGVALGLLTAATATFKKVVSEIVGYVRLANPGAVKRFNMAVEDTVAVIGHKLTPAVELLTKGTRLLGDFLAAILPSENDMREALLPLGEALQEARKSLESVAPLVREVFITSMQEAAFWIKEFATEMRFGLEALKLTAGIFFQFKRQPLPSSTGAAARQHTFQAPTSYAKSVYSAIASGKGQDPARETADNTAKTNTLLEGLQTTWQAVKDFLLGGWIVDLGSKLGDALKAGWQSIKGDFKLPDLNIADLLAPAFKLPEFKLPELKLPDFQLPDIAGPLADAANKIPDAIKSALSELPERIATAIKDSLPGLPSIPIPGIDPSGGENPILNAARKVRERWSNPFG